MKFTILLALLFAADISIAYADLVYNIDYEAPAYTNGQQVVGAGNISDSVNGFASQALLIHDGGGLSYFAPDVFTSGIHAISWEFSVPVAQSSSEIISLLTQSAYIAVTMSGGGTEYLIEYGAFPLGEPRQSVPFTVGQSYSFQLLLDLDTAQYDLFLNAAQLLDNEPLQFGPNSLDHVSFGQSQTVGVQAGIDNFRWEVVPEPSTISLLALAGVGLAIRALRSRQPAS